MKVNEAKKLIKDVFESFFDKGKYRIFIKNLLKDVEEKTFTYTGNIIPRAFDNYIRKLERIGKYEDEEGNVIDILIVELRREHSIEYARSTQRNFIRWYLAGSRGGQMKDAALVAFHSERSADWRFSFIKMQYSLETKKDELTPAKRYSFLVGEKGKSHTAQQQLVRLLKSDDRPLLSDIEEAFNIETVTNEFFEKYKVLVFNLVDEIEKIIAKDDAVKNEFESKNIQVIDFAKKLMGQIVFIYFLQRKGWLGLQNGQKYGDGDRNFLRSLYDMKRDDENFFNDYLEYLFYDALSQKRVTDFYTKFNCRIPFLNGGLFDPINFYDWQKTDIVIPDELFTNTHKTKEGDIGDGILDVFDRYNFTVKEDEPLDKEVAVDPEMLGKVFERMLDVKERKSKGAFYTPREIVHYMSQESLIHYLDTALNSQPKAYRRLGEKQTDMFGNKVAGQMALEVELTDVRVPKEDIEKLIKHGEQFIEKDVAILDGSLKESNNKYQIPESIRKHAKEIDLALENIRVCDPAVGSGAFPVGVMTEIVKARSILFKIQNPGKEPSHYEFKNHAIHHCLYGVDIDPSAVEICKLRLWLSLVVDEQRIDAIEPLPNLDYKIVKGNSLIGLPDNVMRDVNLEKEINYLMGKYYTETDKDIKKELKQVIDSKIKQLLKSAEQFTDYPIDFDFKLFFYEVFEEKGGFDIVIGNPPYGASISVIEKKYLDREFIDYKTSTKNSAIYFIYFTQETLNKNGINSFIVPKSICYSYGWNKCARFIHKNLIKLIDTGKAFEKVKLEQIIFVRKNNFLSKYFKNGLYINNTIKEFSKIPNTIFNKFNILLAGQKPEEYKVLSKILEKTKHLFGEYVSIERGLNWQALAKKFPGNTPIYRGAQLFKYYISQPTDFIDISKFDVKEYSYQLKPKILNQLAIAHVQNPYPHFYLQATLDISNRLVFETISCTFNKNPKINLKFILAINNSKIFEWLLYKFIYSNAIRSTRYDEYYVGRVPTVDLENVDDRPFNYLVDFILLLKKKYGLKSLQSKKYSYFEKIIDGMVFELYFEEEVKKAERDIIKYLNNLTPITDDMTDEDKMEIITKAFNELYDKDHPVRQNLEAMNEIEEIRIIKGLEQ